MKKTFLIQKSKTLKMIAFLLSCHSLSCYHTTAHTLNMNQKQHTLKNSQSKAADNMNNHEIPVRVVELSTGHQLIVLDKNLRKNVKIVFDFIIPLHDKSGKAYPQGISNLCEAYFAEAFPKGSNRIDFQKSLILEEIDINISSSTDRFTIILTCHSDKANDAIEKLKSFILNSDISRKSFELLKQKQKISLQQAMHDPSSMAKEKFLNYFLGEDAPYIVSLDKSISALDSLSKSDIQEFIQKLLSTQKMKSVFVGEALSESVKNSIESFIQTLSKEEIAEQTIPTFVYPSKDKIHHMDAVAPQAVVLFAHPALEKSHPDFIKFYVLRSILGSMPFESRIWQEVREKRGLAYSVTIRPYTDVVRSFTLGSLGTNPKNIDGAIDIIQKEWEMSKAITKDELSLHKDFIIGSFILSFDKSNQAINTLLDFTRQGFTVDEIKTVPSAVKDITLDEINRVATEHLHKDKLYFFSYGQKQQGESK